MIDLRKGQTASQVHEVFDSAMNMIMPKVERVERPSFYDMLSDLQPAELNEELENVNRQIGNLVTKVEYYDTFEVKCHIIERMAKLVKYRKAVISEIVKSL